MALKEYFDIRPLIDATRFFSLELRPELQATESTEKSCNGFLTHVDGDVYFVTAWHCVKDTVEEEKFFQHPEKLDIAVRHIPHTELTDAPWRVTDVDALPELNEQDFDDVSGAVVTSMSQNSFSGKKRHYSIAMPDPVALRGSDRGQEFIRTRAFFEPPIEGKVLGRLPDNRAVFPAAGSSGSMVGAYIDGKYVAVGTLIGMRMFEEPCTQLCYAIAYFSEPNAVREAVYAERKRRLEGMLEKSNPPDIPEWETHVKRASK